MAVIKSKFGYDLNIFLISVLGLVRGSSKQLPLLDINEIKNRK